MNSLYVANLTNKFLIIIVHLLIYLSAKRMCTYVRFEHLLAEYRSNQL
jgi:hypothetical protein